MSEFLAIDRLMMKKHRNHGKHRKSTPELLTIDRLMKRKHRDHGKHGKSMPELLAIAWPMRRRHHLPETAKTVAKPAKQGLQPLFAVLWIRVSKSLLRNLYWQYFFVLFVTLN